MVKIRHLAYEDLSTRIGNSFLLMSRCVIFPNMYTARIVFWPALVICISVIQIEKRSQWIGIKTWSTRVPPNFIWYHTTTGRCHIFYILANDWSVFFGDYASAIRFANNPVVYVWFDHELVPDFVPLIPIYSSKWRLIEWRSSWNKNIGVIGRPIWTGS